VVVEILVEVVLQIVGMITVLHHLLLLIHLIAVQIAVPHLLIQVEVAEEEINEICIEFRR
jgi:hypothetical protein